MNNRREMYAKGYKLGAAWRARFVAFGVPVGPSVAPDPKAHRVLKYHREAFTGGWHDGYAGREAREMTGEGNFFHIAAATWDVGHALLISKDLPVIDADVSGMFKVLPLIRIDTAYAMAGTDLTKPLIVVRLRHPDTGEDMGPWVIDGWHRLYRAAKEGLKDLPVKLLEGPDAAAVLHMWMR